VADQPERIGISSSLDGTGTSFAAPLAAGACALLFDARLSGPGAYCDDLRAALTTQAGHTTAIGTIADPSRSYGHGYMQLDPIWTLHDAQFDTDTWLKEDPDDFGSGRTGARSSGGTRTSGCWTSGASRS
jgi:hypothetical protein